MSSVSVKPQKTSETVLSKEVGDIPLSERIDIFKNFNPLFLSLTDCWNGTLPNPILNQILRKIGPSHQSSTQIIFSKNGPIAPIAISYRVQTHYAANTTGVVNSLFLFLKDGINLREFEELMELVSTSTSLLLGTSDLMLVHNDEKDLNTSQVPKSRVAKFLIADLQVLARSADAI
jgi:hypothetical protein